MAAGKIPYINFSAQFEEEKDELMSTDRSRDAVRDACRRTGDRGVRK